MPQSKAPTRLASIDDIPQIVALWKRFMTEEHTAVPDASVAEAEGLWTARLLKLVAHSKVTVVEGQDLIVGFLAFLDSDDRPWIPPGVAYVVDIYVAPEARATSAARRLFDATAQLPTCYAQLWTNTHRDNRRVQILLQRAGFEPLHDFEVPGLQDQFYYKLDNAARCCAKP